MAASVSIAILTTLALLRLITAASVFWIALQLCRDAARANVLLWSVAALGCAYAAYGLFAFALTPGRVLWFENPYSRGFVTSTFINPNSFVAYAGMGFIAICGLILRLYRHEFAAVGGSIRFRIATFIEVTGQKGAVLLGGALGDPRCPAAVGIARGDRSPRRWLCSVLGALTLRLRKRQSVEQRVAIIIFGCRFGGGTVLWFSAISLSGRSRSKASATRVGIAVYTITMRSILGAPILGYGYGTFADVFPMFRDQSVSTWGRWQMAHNTYLEVFQGLGLLFGSMLVASVVLLVLRCVRGAMTRQTNETMPCVAASVAFFLGVHALVDFSLQMQAIAITFMALLGAGVAQSESSRLAAQGLIGSGSNESDGRQYPFLDSDYDDCEFAHSRSSGA